MSLQETRLDAQSCNKMSAVIIGNPESIFPRTLAEYWQTQGIDVTIVTRHWTGVTTFPCGTKILTSSDYESSIKRKLLGLLSNILQHVENIMVKTLGKKRYENAMVLRNENKYRPSFVGSLTNAFSIVSLVNTLKPDFVLGQEVFDYGFTTALCSGMPRILMPWGGDIYTFSETSLIAFQMVKYALRNVDLVCPASIVASEYIPHRFHVNNDNLFPLSWGVKTNIFCKAGKRERVGICHKYGISPDSLIILNSRRFLPSWGCNQVLKAFTEYARENTDAHFVLLGGKGSESFTEHAQNQIMSSNLENRFTLFKGDIPLAECAELMSISDVFLSLMQARDMRSSSILQAAAAGGAPIISEQKEYREMEKLGFKAIFVNLEDISSIIMALRRYASDSKLLREYVTSNLTYIMKHESFDSQMQKLLSRITKMCK